MERPPVMRSTAELHRLLDQDGRLLVCEHAGEGTVVEFTGRETGNEELSPEEFATVGFVPAAIMEIWHREAPRGYARKEFDGPLVKSRYFSGRDTWRDRPCPSPRPERIGTVGGIDRVLFGRPAMLAANLDGAAELWEYVGKPWQGPTPSYGAFRRVAWVSAEALMSWLGFSDQHAEVFGPRWSNGPFSGTWTGGHPVRPWGRDEDALADAILVVWATQESILSRELRDPGSFLIPHSDGGAVIWRFKPKGRRRHGRLFAPVVAAPEPVYRAWRRSPEGMGACYDAVDGLAEGWFLAGNDIWRDPTKGRVPARAKPPRIIFTLDVFESELARFGRCLTVEPDGSGKIWQYSGAPWRPDEDSLVTFRLVGVVLAEGMKLWRDAAGSVAPKSLTNGPVAGSWSVRGMASWYPRTPEMAARAGLEWVATAAELSEKLRQPGRVFAEREEDGAVLLRYDGSVPAERPLKRTDFKVTGVVGEEVLSAWRRTQGDALRVVTGPVEGAMHLPPANVWSLAEGIKVSRRGDFLVDLAAGTITWRNTGETVPIELVYIPPKVGRSWVDDDFVLGRALHALAELLPSDYPVPEPPPEDAPA